MENINIPDSDIKCKIYFKKNIDNNNHYIITKIIIPYKINFDFIAIFDGYGEDLNEDDISLKLLKIFPITLANNLNNLKNFNSKKVIFMIYKTISDVDYNLYYEYNHKSGSSGIFTLIPENQNIIYICNFGLTKGIISEKIRLPNKKNKKKIIYKTPSFYNNQNYIGIGNFYKKLFNKVYNKTYAILKIKPSVYPIKYNNNFNIKLSNSHFNRTNIKEDEILIICNKN